MSREATLTSISKQLWHIERKIDALENKLIAVGMALTGSAFAQALLEPGDDDWLPDTQRVRQ